MPTDITHLRRMQYDDIHEQMELVRRSMEQSVSAALIGTKTNQQSSQVARAAIQQSLQALIMHGVIADVNISEDSVIPNMIEIDVRLQRDIRMIHYTMSIDNPGNGAPMKDSITKIQFILGEV